MSENQHNLEAKEDGVMAMAINKPDEATIIKKEAMSLFLQQLRSQKATKDYWEECAKARNAFSASEIEKMKKMCSGEEK